MLECRFYVGADNHTGNPQKEKLVEILNQHFDGYTTLSGNGYWQGSPELSTVVIIHTDKTVAELRAIAELLKIGLNQDCIAMTTIQTDFELV
jgi:hypothetical protein